MKTGIQEAFTDAAQRAQSDFEMRNAVDVITPAARRVTRHRAAVKVGAGLASVAVVGGVLWGAGAFAEARVATVDPAQPTVETWGLDVRPNEPDAVVPANAWSTLDLAVRANTRSQGAVSIDATAGMICNHAGPMDDPRLAQTNEDGTITHRSAMEDCSATWFIGGPATAITHWGVSVSELDHSLTYSFSIRNDSEQPIAIDTASVFLWIETDPNSTSDSVTAYASTVAGPSMWDSMDGVSALLDSRSDTTIIPVDGDFSSAITATTGIADGDPLAAILAGDTPYRVSIWARVHEAAPSGDASYLIQLGSNNDVSCEFACDVVVNPDRP